MGGVESLGTAAYSTSSSFTWAGFAAHPSGPAPGSTSLIGIARPLSSDLDAAFAPGSNVRTALQGESLMLAETELAQPYANTVFGFETDLTSGKTVDLGIGLSAAELVDMDGGFESLEFTVSTGPNDTTILDVELDGAAAVQAFFADRVLLLPELQGLAGHVAFGVSVTLRSSAPSTSFGAAILFAAVPEPGVLWLFATLACCCRGGGIGRRDGLRSRCREACRFESCPRHRETRGGVAESTSIDAWSQARLGAGARTLRSCPTRSPTSTSAPSDLAATRRFYERVFGWTFEAWGPPDFFMIWTGAVHEPGAVHGSLSKRWEPRTRR